MKLHKRTISLVFAVMLISAFAIQAAAATTTYSGRYGNCLYAATTTCETRSCSGIMEATPLNGTTENDHHLAVDLIIYEDSTNYNYYLGDMGLSFAANARTTTYTIYKMNALYLINENLAYNQAMTPT